MKILVGPVEWARNGQLIREDKGNPGVGGTEFMSALLAHLLTQNFAAATTTLWLFGHSPTFSSPNIKTVVNAVPHESYDIHITPVFYGMKYASEIALLTTRARILWSHHPHDPYLEQAETLSHEVVVFVSEYARASVWPRRAKSVVIRNPMSPNSVASQPRKPRQPTIQRIGYVGALTEFKGFHHIARHWKEIETRLPNSRLEVVGANSLYGDEDAHKLFPTSNEYGNTLLEAFGGIVPPSVVFRGRIDSAQEMETIIESWDIGLVNPSGASESDPATVKDFLRLGVPVIGGGNYGQFELLRPVPFATVSKPGELPSRLEFLSRRPASLQRMSVYGLEVAEKLRRQTDLNLGLWTTLIERILSETPRGTFRTHGSEVLSPSLRFRVWNVALRNRITARAHSMRKRVSKRLGHRRISVATIRAVKQIQTHLLRDKA